MIYDENDYDTDDEDYYEFSPEILRENEEDRKISIINFYKEKLYHEPEFIGIKNICSAKILHIIETTTYINYKLNNKYYKLNEDQIKIFDNMYLDLFNEIDNIYIYDLITNKIFNKIYINRDSIFQH